MKKTIILLVFAFAVQGTLLAQRQQPSEEEMNKHRSEMIQKQAEKLSKDMNLKDDSKEAFVQLYTQYRNELAELDKSKTTEERGRGEKDKDSKKLTDEEASQQLEKYFSDQEKQIAKSQSRLEIDKKYYEEFKKTLTPQQLVKVFSNRRNRQEGFGGPRGNNMRGQQNGGFGGERPGNGDFGGGDF